jgi:MYXO-CTERM domain-containing protein
MRYDVSYKRTETMATPAVLALAALAGAAASRRQLTRTVDDMCIRAPHHAIPLLPRREFVALDSQSA